MWLQCTHTHTQDPGTQQLVQQARLAVLQEATRARLAKQLRCADPDSLQECQQLAADAQLGADVLGRVQAMQHASTALQAAVEKLKQQQQKQKQGVGVGDGVGSDTSELQAQLKAAHKQVEELCKPGELLFGVEWVEWAAIRHSSWSAFGSN